MEGSSSPPSGLAEQDYISAEEAARLLGVNLATLYAYVSRKGLRSTPVAGSKAHRYWRADVERLAKREKPTAALPVPLGAESAITLLTERGPFYRGRSAVALAEHASLEDVAGMLWQVDSASVFTMEPPRSHPNFAAMEQLLAKELPFDRAVAHFCLLEHADLRAFDLSPQGMARTGADVVRWLTAILLGTAAASPEPVHLQFGLALGLEDQLVELVRRLLVLGADHGFEQSALAVRAVASMGVTPWRAVATGLSIAAGRRSKFGHSEAVRRFVSDVVASPHPEDLMLRMIKAGETPPGFASTVYPKGDPRGAALAAYCSRALTGDEAFDRLRRVLDIAETSLALRPSFSLMGAFASIRLGLSLGGENFALSSPQAPFLAGRSVGWIAHAVEQYASGETQHREGLYKGRLPEMG
jgi:citrate synthase